MCRKATANGSSAAIRLPNNSTGLGVAIVSAWKPTSAGIGLRLPHIAEMVATRPPVGFLEIHPENFRVGALVDRINPFLISGHLAWSTHQEEFLNDLLPLPFNDEALQLVSAHIHEVQDALGRPYLLENPSSYVSFCASTMTEAEFLAELVNRSGCRLLCDVSNVYLSAHNIGYDAHRYMDSLPGEAIAEWHLGGFTPEPDEFSPDSEVWVDTHAAPIADRAWDLYAYAIRRFGASSRNAQRHRRSVRRQTGAGGMG